MTNDAPGSVPLASLLFSQLRPPEFRPNILPRLRLNKTYLNRISEAMVYAPQTMQHFYVSDLCSQENAEGKFEFCLVLLPYVEQFLPILRLLLMVLFLQNWVPPTLGPHFLIPP